MTQQLLSATPVPPSKYKTTARVIAVGLAYFVSAKLGLATPYINPHITLMWLATGIAVAALMRWGYICWPGIFLGALATNFSIDASPLLDTSIALGDTLSPLLATWLLRRLKFHDVLDRAYDILILVIAAAGGMLLSASGGVSSLLISKTLSVDDAGTAWLSWWVGDFMGVLLVTPLLLNISRTNLKKLWVQRMEFVAWCLATLAIYWGLFYHSSNELSYSHQLAFVGVPTVIWAAMRFGVMGSSLGVLLPVFMAAWATERGLGPFYNGDDMQGRFQLGAFFLTLVLVELMVSAIQTKSKRAVEALKQNELRFRQMFERHSSIMLLIDPVSGVIVDANLAASYFYGYPLEHLIGMDITQINTQSPAEVSLERAQAMREERNYFIFPHRLANGEMRTVEVHSSPIEMGEHRVLFSIIHDITERHQIKENTEALLRRYQTLLKTAMDGIYMLDMQGNIVEANDAFCNMLGYSLAEMLTLNLANLNAQYTAEQLGERLRSFLGKNARFETVHRSKSGSLIEVEISTSSVDIDGQYYFITTSRDISERKRAEQKTEVLMRRHQVLMKSASEGIHIMDMQGNIVEANQTFCDMLGYTAEEMTNLNVVDWDAKWSKEELIERFKKLIKVDGALFETLHRHKDGFIIEVEVSTTGAEIDGKYYLYASSRDISERKKVEQELRDSEQKARMMMDSAADAVFVVDPVTERWVYINNRFETLLGYTRAEVLARDIYDFVTPEFRDIYRDRFINIAQSGAVSTREFRLNRKDGTRILLEMNAITLPDGTVYGACRDITERKRGEESQRIAAATFETQEAIMITDPDATILRVNQAFQDITGYDATEVIGCNPRIFQSGRHNMAFYQSLWSALLNTGKWSGEIWDKRKDGSIYPKLSTITAVYNDRHQVTNYVAVFRDITLNKKSEQEIHQLAFYDSLTQLPNRRLLLDRLRQAMVVGTRNGRHGALLFLDLDHFKTINDTRGHAMGDQLLVEVARRLQTGVREGDSVARLGGDEFVVVLEDLSSEPQEAASQTELVAEKIRRELDKPYVINGLESHSTVSIGISLFRGHQESAEDLLQHTDVAMYQAKVAGRNTIRFFDPKMQTALDMRAGLEADLRHALEKQQFKLYYQIQVDSLRRPLGAEALLRWQHPERGLVSPMEFIPLAEEIGLIVPMGLWVLKTACVQLKEWQSDALTRDLTLAVNVSAKQFRQPDFVAQVQRALLESSIKPSHLKLEMTESIVLENVEDTINKMREIKALGVSFSMDDFGTGYSSLQYLKRLPLDQIKIDQSFVRDIISDPNDAAIVQTIIAMTEALGLNVIAEGVETEAQWEFLDRHGCHAFQGYLFGKPVPLDQFERVLRGEQK
jgi:diguanylate cyclase (GGDEF)-like protein/PAS domain S-box-containing protein